MRMMASAVVQVGRGQELRTQWHAVGDVLNYDKKPEQRCTPGAYSVLHVTAAHG